MAQLYRIPDNFIEGGRLFGGIVKTRNFAEAVVFGCMTGLLGMKFPATGTTRISVLIFFAAIGFIPGLLGVNDGPFSAFLAELFTWYRNKRIMIFNDAVEARTDSITDRMLDVKTSRESFSDAINRLKPARSGQKEKTFVEGVDFTFNADEELSKYIEDAELSGKKHRFLFGK